MINKNETYIVLCEEHIEMLKKVYVISTPELVTCPKCETPFSTGIRCYPQNQHNKGTDYISNT